MDAKIFDKLQILGQGAKYDVACASSGVNRSVRSGKIGSAAACGLCHSFAADGRCISLLKVLLSNACVFDCRYCVSRRSADVPRATFTPRELAELTIEFYRRNYIEGLFLSSAVIGSPDRTVELMTEVLRLLRGEYGFTGYIHAKAIPGASAELLESLGMLCDRMSVNIEMPTKKSLALMCPDKSTAAVTDPMRFIRSRTEENRLERKALKSAPQFVPAGQSTQMIIGATPETDFQILSLTERLYQSFALKRVYFSAYVPVVDDACLPALTTPPQLLREHRLYQADWLLRFYGFEAREILDERAPMLHPYLDPKSNWALAHLDRFPLEVNQAEKEELLRVPGIGVRSLQRILVARRQGSLGFEDLKRLGVVMKRAKYFLTCGGRPAPGIRMEPQEMLVALMSRKDLLAYQRGRHQAKGPRQLSFFDQQLPGAEDLAGALSGEL